MHPKSHTTVPVVIRVEGLDSPYGPIEVTISIRPTANAEPLGPQAVATPFVPVAGRQGPRPPLIHAFATRLSDTNRVGLANLAYWSTGLRRSPHYLLNKALTHHLALLTGPIRQATGAEPPIPQAIPCAVRMGRKSPRPALIYAFATHLSDPNKVGLDNVAYWNTDLEEATDYLVNEALTYYLSLFPASMVSDRWPRRSRRTKDKAKQ